LHREHPQSDTEFRDSQLSFWLGGARGQNAGLASKLLKAGLTRFEPFPGTGLCLTAIPYRNYK